MHRIFRRLRIFHSIEEDFASKRQQKKQGLISWKTKHFQTKPTFQKTAPSTTNNAKDQHTVLQWTLDNNQQFDLDSRISNLDQTMNDLISTIHGVLDQTITDEHNNTPPDQ